MMNPIIPLDYPDPDVIRVGEKYYLVSTTMYFMPGCEILESTDLINWKHATYVYDCLEETEQESLQNGKNAYGKGMWAASLRFHKGLFYLCFVANDTGKTYLFTSESIEGPWKKSYIEGFYHDASLLFDDDDKVYIAYGNTKIYLTELKQDLSGPKEGGFHKCIVDETSEYSLGYEGSHLYKINGNYYIFFIHSAGRDRFFRTEAMFMTKSLEEDFVGGDIFSEDLNFRGSGVAQGGIVDTPDGKWYSIMFQDRGAAGRFPVLVPVTWEDDRPVFGDCGKMDPDWDALNDGLVKEEDRKTNTIDLLIDSDDFSATFETTGDKQKYGSFGLKSVWQFNHNPDLDGFEVRPGDGIFRIKPQCVVKDLLEARNTLAQRMVFPVTQASVLLDGSHLKDGDIAGLCALQSLYGMIGLKRENGKLYLIMQHRVRKDEQFVIEEVERIPFEREQVRLSLVAEFEDTDFVRFFYEEEGEEKMLGSRHDLFFTLDHFTGCRIGLFSYSTQEIGGYADFMDFKYER